MEAFGAFLDEELESLSKLFSCEDSDFLLHFNGHGDLFPDGRENTNAGAEESLCFPCTGFDANLYCISQERTNSSKADESALFTIENHQAANAVNFLQEMTTNAYESMGFCATESSHNDVMVPVFPDDEMEELLQLKAKMIGNALLGNAGVQPPETREEMQLKRKHDVASPEAISFDPTPKKQSRASNSRNKKRSTQPRKNKKATLINDDEEENNGGSNGQSSSTCSSEEDDSNASQEQNGGSTSESKGSASNGKAKANRGPATDPQSLYARKRRERINERLRILQNLVPNGTKVDISTMLEEAVHYVKFLQLQIKLLSSDDLWMYAPIAYNGMDIGVFQKIVPNLRL